MNILMLPLAIVLFFSCGNNTTAKQKTTVNDDTAVVIAPTKQKQDVPNNSTASVEIVTPEEEIDVTIEDTIQKTPENPKIEEEKEQPEEIATMEKKEEALSEMDTKEAAKSPEVEIEEEVEVEEVIIEKEKEQKIEGPVTKKAVDHSPWNSLLKKHVNNLGNVDYKAFAQDAAALNTYLETLAQNAPTASTSKNEKLAYYINLYNAATVKLIVDNYPTKSIKSIKSPWGKKIVPIGDEKFSLGDIEHKILRKMNEPRIHFAINCASFSCPKLINKAFTPGQMEQQLQEASVDFVNDTTRNIITEDKIQLSEIFKWYKKDFMEKGTSLKDYINKYSKTTISAKAKVSYLKYDWSLNEAK